MSFARIASIGRLDEMADDRSASPTMQETASGAAPEHQSRSQQAEGLNNRSLHGVLDECVESGVRVTHQVLLEAAVQVCHWCLLLNGSLHGNLCARNCRVLNFEPDNPAAVNIRLTGACGGRQPAEIDSGMLRWMAPEAIQRRKWSVKTDVWALGVLLWEIFSMASLPYGFIVDSDIVAKRVCEGELLEESDGCPTIVYKVIKQCWRKNPQDRPSFELLEEQFKRLSSEFSESAESWNTLGRRNSDLGEELCIVCFDAPAECAVIPCGHSCLCVEHSALVEHCPICRAPAQSVIKITKSGIRNC